ncbi:hypothetical protein E2C01_079165 [Portunus trituberculatus]|uniref:Uncharacterized protein n=1 Tax=Portunus trituberculatus TaxID=210409 RepID=A0A5B7IUU7_PORTR|nr:hypothetical protein [Portunus trituberculatus]
MSMSCSTTRAMASPTCLVSTWRREALRLSGHRILLRNYVNLYVPTSVDAARLDSFRAGDEGGVREGSEEADKSKSTSCLKSREEHWLGCKSGVYNTMVIPAGIVALRPHVARLSFLRVLLR